MPSYTYSDYASLTTETTSWFQSVLSIHFFDMSQNYVYFFAANEHDAAEPVQKQQKTENVPPKKPARTFIPLAASTRRSNTTDGVPRRDKDGTKVGTSF